MKVLILSQYFWPESFRINEVARSLRDTGCEITILTGQPNYPDGGTFPGYSAFSTQVEDHDGLTIYRVPLVPRGHGSAFKLIANYISFIIFASLFGPWLLRGQRFELVFVYGVSPILKIFPAMVIRRLKSAALVTWVQDLWPESLEVTGFVRNARVLSAVSRVVGWLYQQNDLVLVQSRGFVPLVAAMSGATPVEYHPNPGELAFSNQPEGPPDLVLKPGFNIVFAGNLGTVQALETILSAADQLRDMHDVRFVLIGSGSRSEWLAQEVHRLALGNIELAGRFAPESMPGILAQASALLVSLVRDPVLSQTVPSKIQAYLAAGRPVIASLDGEGARVICAAGAGVVCAAENPDALAASVRALHALSSDERAQLGQAGRRYYQNNFEPSALALRLKNRFELLLTTSNKANAL